MNDAPLSGRKSDPAPEEPIISLRHDSFLVCAASIQQRLELGAKHSFRHIKRWLNKPENLAPCPNPLPLRRPS